MKWRHDVPTIALGLAIVLAGCTPEPRDVVPGHDVCAHCRMTVAEPRFAAQLVTQSGRQYVFDAIECLAAFKVAGGEIVGHEHSIWVADYFRPNVWLPAAEAQYVRAETIRSPMGMNLAAAADEESAAMLRTEEEMLLDWQEVQAFVRSSPLGVMHTGHDR